MDDSSLLTGGIGLVALGFLFVLGLLWFLLPFAVFGIKDLLRELIRETRASREVLQALRAEADARDSRKAPPRAPPPRTGPPHLKERLEPTFGELIAGKRDP